MIQAVYSSKSLPCIFQVSRHVPTQFQAWACHFRLLRCAALLKFCLEECTSEAKRSKSQMFYSLDFIARWENWEWPRAVATSLLAMMDWCFRSFKMIIIQSFEAMHAAEVLLLFPDPLGIDIPALQTCLHFRAAEMNVLKKVCTMHSQCTSVPLFISAQQSILPTAFRGLGPPGDTCVLTFSRLPTWVSQDSQDARNETNRNHTSKEL